MRQRRLDDLPRAEQARSDAAGLTQPLTDRVLLYLLRCDPRAWPHARMLAAALDCAGRRYQDLRAAFDVLLDAGHIDHAQRPDAATRRERGYALTREGRVRAEALRDHYVSVSAHPRG